MSSSVPLLPSLTSAQVRELDRLAREKFGIPTEWLMEAAGWQVARHCRGRVAVLCGAGNNGGDGLAAARHLHRWGRLHSVACIDRSRLQGPARAQAEALEADGVAIASAPELAGATLVVDALLGTGLSRAPEGRYADWIERIHQSAVRVLAVDVPSGLDSDTGAALLPAVRAATTVTLGLPKPGLLAGEGPAHAGEVWVADIGMPLGAYAELGLEVPPHLFSLHDRVQLEAIRL